LKDRFVSLLTETQRPGIQGLIAWLTDKTDFFTAPASTKYHGACETGLLEHSLEVLESLDRVCDEFLPNISRETRRITALLHDICKANFYVVSERNAKDPIIDGKQMTGWHKVPYYAIEDSVPLGHGEKSVILLQAFIRPTIEEIMAIRWHMGAFGSESYADRQGLAAAMDKYPLILAIQMADLAATYFGKK
jgi:hypothetical protein